MRKCPPSDAFAKLLACELEGADLQAFEDHLRVCALCASNLNARARDWDDASWARLLTPSIVDTIGESDRELLKRLKRAMTALKGEASWFNPRSDAEDGEVRRIGDYEILELLGRGGMGVVYKSRQCSLNRIVALKMITASAEDRDAFDRFRDEAEAVARMHHPNIVQVHEIGSHDGRPFISLEFIEGGTLAQLLRSARPPGRLAAEVVETLSRAIQVAHLHGIVHRDLKPANILLQPVTETSLPGGAVADLAKAIPKITDFGLAKKTDVESDRTRTGAILGTPNYMAPEQAEGQTHRVGPRTDVYALGAILYEMLTGRPPFRGETPIETLRQILNSEIVPPTRLSPNLHRDLQTICLKALAKDPERRYATALELAEDLDRFRNGAAIRARPELLWEKASRTLRRHRSWAMATLLILIVLLGVAVYGNHVANRLQKTKAVTTEIDALLEKPQLNEDYLKRVEASLAEMEYLDPDLAASRRQQLLARYAETFRSSLRNGALKTEDVESLERTLAVVKTRYPALTSELRVDLKKRMSQWQPTVDLVSPFANWSQLFTADQVELSQGLLLPKSPAVADSNQSSIVPGQIASDGNARLEVTFGPGWNRSAEVGILLHSDGGGSGTTGEMYPSPDGRLLAVGSGAGLNIWDLNRGTIVRHASNQDGFVPAFSPDSKVIATSGAGKLEFTEVDSGRSAAILPEDLPCVTAAAFSPSGHLLAVGKHDGQIVLWDLAAKKQIDSFQGHRAFSRILRFSHHGNSFASFGFERFNGQKFGLAPFGHESTVKVWKVGSHEERILLSEPVLPRTLSFSPDDSKLAASFNLYSYLRVFDLNSGLPLYSRENASVGESPFSPDGQILCVTRAFDDTQLLNAATGQITSTFEAPSLTRSFRATFASGAKMLCIEDRQGRVLLYDLARRDEIRSLVPQSYSFLLRTPTDTLDPEHATSESSVGLVAIQRQPDRVWSAEIRRDGKLLCKRLLSLPTDGTLDLQASQEGNRLTFVVNGAAPLIFDDATGFCGEHPGTFGLIWPLATPLVHFRAFQQIQPEETSSMEKGDLLFARRQFQDALNFYRAQAFSLTANESLQECRYKQAMCLLALKQQDEATRILEPLGEERGERWPFLALSELLKIRLHERKYDQANAVLEVLSLRFPSERFTPLLPETGRDDILAAYGDQARGLRLFIITPQVLENLERGAAAEEYFYGATQGKLRYRLARAYHAAGKNDKGIAVLEKIFPRLDESAKLRELPPEYLLEYIWQLRGMGHVDRARQILDDALSEADENLLVARRSLFLGRACVHASRQEWVAAEQDVAKFRALAPSIYDRPWDQTWACLQLGFLRQRAGDRDGARAIWAEGLRSPEQTEVAFGFEFMHNLILHGVLDDLSDRDLQQLTEKLTRGAAGADSLFGAAMAAVNIPPSVLRRAWRTPRGQRIAQEVVFREVPLQELLRHSAALLMAEWMNQGAFQSQADGEQDEVLWKLANDIGGQVMSGQLGTNQLLPLALTWKGIGGPLGWSNVSDTLSPAMKSRFAYLFGKRFESLNHPDGALKFLRVAREIADREPVDSTLYRLADREIKKLEK